MLNRTTILRAAACWLFSLVLAAPVAQAATASPDGVWSQATEAAISRSAAARQIVPKKYATLSLDRAALEGLLAQAPMEGAVVVEASPLQLSLPLPDGSFAAFRVVESPIMEPALAAKFPNVRTWLAQGIDDPTATARFDLTPTGFHGQIISWEGTTYIDPYQPDDTAHYISYRKRDFVSDKKMICSVTGQAIPTDAPNFQKRGIAAKISSGANLRTYRLAVAATGEYTAFHGGTVAGGQAAIVTTINRVNGIYEREVAVRMVLVANNNLLVYSNATTDPYTNDDGFAMLAQNQTNVTTIIGTGNFDFGHVVSTGGGGVAGLGVICNASQKARGVTGSPAPVNDPFDVDYVAHEMGHQFGGNHTFNSTQGVGACNGNRNASTAFEVASGITIQAYAGICAPDNVQNNSVDYFHRASLAEILAHVGNASTGGSCGTQAATGNTPPVVSTAASFNIPASTPFELTASGSDGNGDTLSYLWEQYDLGPTNPAGTLTDNGGPLFRNYNPSSSPSRIFPALIYVLNNANVPPAGSWELLPSTTRSMNFRVTARDNRAGGGGTNEAPTVVNVTGTAGPFVVTAPNTAVSWQDAGNQTVTWNVANTSAAPISTANVRIRLSTNGGTSWPIELAASVPNTGSAVVFVPASVPATSQARIRVEAVGSVYFDVSNANFTITDNPNPTNEPSLSIASSAVLTGNNLIEPNECNQLSITLGNSGLTAATGVSATLSTTNPNVTITQATASFANIAPGGSQTSSTPFQISSSNALVCLSNVDLTLTVSYSGGGSPFVGALSLPVGQAAPGGSNYTFASTTGATIPAGGVLLAGSQGDDTLTSLSVPAGFNFSVYGTAVSGGSVVRVTSNGNLQIAGSGGSSSYTNGSLPSAGNADGATYGAFGATVPVLLPYWTDLDMGTGQVTGGGIYTQLTGVAPNRKWIVEWRGEQQGTSGTAITVKFAIEFNEGSSTFAYVYELPASGGALSTIGVQAATSGTLVTEYSFNTAAGQRLTATLPAPVCSSGTGGCVVTPPGVTVTQSGGTTTVTEGAATDSYMLVLNAQPSSDVTLTVAPDAQLSVALTTLTFTSANWATPQTVTVTAVNDAIAEGAHSGSITHSAAGGGYTGVSIASVTASITDNDSAGVAVTPSGGTTTVTEGGATDSYTLVLTSQPTASVTITVSPDAQVSVAPTSLTFTTANWATLQTVTVTAVDDAALEGAHTGVITHGASGGGYNGVSIASVSAQITDNDSAGVSVVQSGGTTTVTEGGATDSYTLVLTAQPTASVVISVSPDAQLSVAPNSLSFTTANWATPQTVTVTAVNDAVAEGAHSGSISHSATGGGYTGVSIAGVTASISDNDSVGVTVTQSGGTTTVTEGGATDSYTLVLTSQPTANVLVTITPDAQLGRSPATLSFTAANWATPQTVTVNAADDTLTEGNHSGVLTHSVSGGDYASVSIASLTVSITDNDGATVNTGPVSQNEGNSGSGSVLFTLQLAGQVAGGFSVNYQTRNGTATAGSDYTSASGTLSFDGSLNPSRTVAVAISGDTTTETDETFFLDLTTAASGVQLTPPSVTATIVNDDALVDPIFEDGFETP